ncbi:HD-GYP domain-containing protein [uncultured Massilia sp.]|uniref:HD-GYP domain-containing protein n=1 Tax=uncultured Massilia sp. TaxID=169973 RepID=UPI0025EC326E|nr:HD domain-containing phosphohydrolase [uncultured Massilia sp.]
MTTTPAGSIVNEHYLNKVMALSEEMGVVASEDIYDTHGTKLLAKGATVSRRLQERLIVHRLRKPLESSIAVDGGTDACMLAECAVQACEASPTLAAIVAASGATAGALRREFDALAFGPAMTMMLTMTERGGKDALRHLAEVATLAFAFATHAGLGPDERRVACMAGVLHDIGELYIDPALVNATRVLAPDEWAHLIVHPHIGRLLIQDLETCPPAVGIAVAEHHERLNGSGYPRAMIVGQSSPAGQLLASAELIAGLLHKPNALQRIELALKIVAGEHPRQVAALVSEAGHGLGARTLDVGAASMHEDEIAELAARLSGATELAGALAHGGKVAPRHADLLLRTRERLMLVQRAFAATGLDMHIAVLEGEGAPPDPFEMFESELALRELSWRVRDIGRDLAIQLGMARTSVPQAEQLLGLLCG